MTSLSSVRAERLISLDDPAAARADVTGGKAAALARARQAGLPALAGYVAPAGEGAAALRAGCAALRDAGRPAARRAVLGVAVDPDLAAALARAVTELGGRAIVRSSSALESDPRWSGAFSSIREIGPGDVAAAARSCWSSAFAPDPLDRLEHCGLEPAALGLSLLVQPDLDPEAGGLARLSGDEVEITWVNGHPGAMLAGAQDGQSARIGPASIGRPAEPPGRVVLRDVAALARAAHASCGGNVIEWAWAGGQVVLLQCGSGSGAGSQSPAASGAGSVSGTGPPPAAPARGVVRLPGRTCVPGDAVGRLRYATPGRAWPAITEPASPGLTGPILVAVRPVASLAPLLFGARGIVCQSGAGDSHLAGVARALGVPMLVQVPLTDVIGPLDSVDQGPGWLAVVSGQRSELVLRCEPLLAVDQDLQLAGLARGVNRAVHAGQRKYRADERAEPDLARGDEADRRCEITRHRSAGALQPKLLEIQLVERQLEDIGIDGAVTEHHRARAGDGYGQADRLRRTHALHDEWRSLAAEQTGDVAFGVGGRNRDVGAEFEGPVALGRRPGHADHREGAARLQELDVHEAGDAQADYHGRLPGRVRDQRLGVYASRQDLEQRRFVVGDLSREHVQPVLVHRDPLGDAAIGVPAEQSSGRAQVGPARAALRAPAAVVAGIDEDPRSAREAAGKATRVDHASHLVAENPGIADRYRAVDNFQICAADSRPGNGDNRFAARVPEGDGPGTDPAGTTDDTR